MMTNETIISLREKRGWSQQFLADQLGVDQGTVSKWENSKASPSGPAKKLLERFVSERPSDETEAAQ